MPHRDMPEAMEEDARSRKRAAQHLQPIKPKLHRSAESLPSVNISSYSVETNNDYDILSGVEQESPPQQPKPLETVIVNAKKERVPSITMGKSYKWGNVSQELQRAGIKQDEYQIKMTSIGIVVKLATMKSYESFSKRCIVMSIPHFTHAVESSKPVRIVLLGLPEMPIDDIKTDLFKHGIIAEDIKTMSIRNARYGDQANYVLYFKKGQITINHLRQQVKAVNNVIVRWAYYDNKRHGPTQCRRCQMWGHGSSNCHLPANCVKCAGAHDSAACDVSSKGTKVPEDKLKCVNCGNKHTANYRGCECKKQYEKTRPIRRAAAANQRSQRRPPFDINQISFPALSQQGATNNSNFRGNSMYLNSNQSYRDRVAGNFNNFNTKNNFNIHNPNNDNSQNRHSPPSGGTEKLFSAEELSEIMIDVIESFRNCKTRADQLKVIARIVPKYLNGF
jgi:hypothetical protein